MVQGREYHKFHDLDAEMTETDRLVYALRETLIPTSWQQVKNELFENGLLTLDQLRCHKTTADIIRRHGRIRALMTRNTTNYKGKKKQNEEPFRIFEDDGPPPPDSRNFIPEISDDHTENALPTEDCSQFRGEYLVRTPPRRSGRA